jgi:DNA-binding PadR family transcriptional regulator
MRLISNKLSVQIAFIQLSEYIKQVSMALAHAILAVLIKQPCSGYDLYKHFEGSVGFCWKASYQQIYRDLTRLEEQRFLRVQIIQQEQRPDKKVYSVTEAGKEYLTAWIVRPAQVNTLKDDLLVKLFAGYLVPHRVIVTELEQHRQQHQQQLSTYQAIEQFYSQHSGTFSTERCFQYITLRYGMRQETGWLNWCEEALQFLHQNLPE